MLKNKNRDKATSTSLLNGRSDLLLAFAGGAVAGGTLALLTSPRSGAGNRQALREAGDNAVAGAKRLPQVIRETSSSLASKVGAKGNDIEAKLPVADKIPEGFVPETVKSS